MGDAYIQKLERRIHRQREQLRQNEKSGMWRLSAGYHKLRQAVMEAFHKNNEKRIATEAENEAFRADLSKLQRINEIQKHTINRWCPCSDHRDKTPPKYCPVCENEALRADLKELAVAAQATFTSWERGSGIDICDQYALRRALDRSGVKDALDAKKGEG